MLISYFQPRSFSSQTNTVNGSHSVFRCRTLDVLFAAAHDLCGIVLASGSNNIEASTFLYLLPNDDVSKQRIPIRSGKDCRCSQQCCSLTASIHLDCPISSEVPSSLTDRRTLSSTAGPHSHRQRSFADAICAEPPGCRSSEYYVPSCAGEHSQPRDRVSLQCVPALGL